MDGTPENPSPLPMDQFDFDLPPELIAQQPLSDRADSRLLVLNRATGEICHDRFREIGSWLRPGDLLVINDTRVMHARLLSRRATGGRIELLVLDRHPDGGWRCMAQPSRRLGAGEQLTLLDAREDATELRATVLGKSADGTVILDFDDFDEIQSRVGRVPLPHYITEHLADPERYQTVYAQRPGSAAAPTAGLHFTHELLSQLSQSGIEIARITLHVGRGTFQPVRADDASEHEMHAERYHVDETALGQIRCARREGRRIVAVGTTSCRTLETIADQLSAGGPLSGETSLYITPGYQFRLVDALITNFHLPRSTLLLLVSAFAGRELVLRVYEKAIEQRYRFYSFGDAMLIL